MIIPEISKLLLLRTKNELQNALQKLSASSSLQRIKDAFTDITSTISLVLESVGNEGIL